MSALAGGASSGHLRPGIGALNRNFLADDSRVCLSRREGFLVESEEGAATYSNMVGQSYHR